MSEPTTRAEIVKANYARGKSNMVRKLFALGYSMQWDVARNPEERKLTRSELVKKHLNQFFLTNEHSPVHEPIDKMTYKQLTVAITVLEKVKSNFISKI